MIDRRPQVFQFTSRSRLADHPRRVARFVGLGGLPRLRSAVVDVGAAVGAVHFRKRSILPPFIKRQNALLDFLLARALRRDIGEIDRKHVGDQDLSGMTFATAIRLILAGKVVAERSLGAFAILCRAARADLAQSVSDDPDRALAERPVGAPLFRAEPETSPFGWTRHRALQSSIAASVV